MTTNKTIAWVARCLVCIVCYMVAGAMALHDVGGWGWFVFMGFLTTPWYSTPKSTDDK